METDVLELALEAEKAHKNRHFISLTNCGRKNYDECSSEYPNLNCGATELTVEPCGGTGCSSLIDTSISAVSLPRDVANGKNGNPTDANVIESVCYTRKLDDWFQEKRAKDSSFWKNEYNVESPQMFMGTQDGTFRIHPARHSATCGNFDPRGRPWYIAGSSGPKNVVLILDTSGSMLGTRIDLLKQAATRIVETLTIADRVGLVQFSSEATVITTHMTIATEANKRDLLTKISALEASGKTNFYDAFRDAFGMIDQTTGSELHVDCNSAILFLTDGKMTDPANVSEDDVVNLVTSEINRIQDVLQKPILLFTYSIGADSASTIHDFPKRLACSSELGVWSQLADETLIVQSLTSYYRLFALGLGTDTNTGFVAWVEPFTFYPSGILGTTASAPVYDRTKEPPLFVGVVGFSFTLSAIDQALGVESRSTETLDRVIRQSTARCPSLNLSICELEAYRGDGKCLSTSQQQCDFVQIEAPQYAGAQDYPSDLWINNNWGDRDYPDRACCKIGSDEPSSQCNIETSSKAVLIAIGCSVGALIVAAAAVFVWRKRNFAAKMQTQHTAAVAVNVTPVLEHEQQQQQHSRPPPSSAPMEAPTDYPLAGAIQMPPIRAPSDKSFYS